MSDKTENDMSDEELEEFEKKTEVIFDKFDKLETLRRLLNKSRVEQMHVIKRSTNLGPQCPYYKKALKLFTENELKDIAWAIKELSEDFKDD